MNTLYLECYAGISGDMAVAALLDLGADENALKKALVSLPVKGFRTEIKRVTKAGLDACDFSVILDKTHENNDHDMVFLHGHDHDHHDHIHHDHTHHDHTHHNHHTNDHEHRGLYEICQIIEQADITTKAKEIAIKIFQILGKAESKAHGVCLEEVHFHEVGAVDSIVDIIAFAVCLDSLCVDHVIIPVLYEGCGTIRCAHGILPVPVPAVVHIVAESGLQLHITESEGEFVTPTGAAIAAAIKTGQTLPSDFSIKKIGMGAGKRNYKRPSILRAMLINENKSFVDSDVIYKLETNIDDCSGEVLAFVMDKLFCEGARDVHYTPVFMKKNRPAYQLTVISKEKDIKKLERIIFEETTTIGIRKVRMERSILSRETITIKTSLGQADIKVCSLEGEKRVYPEYDSVAQLSKETKIPFLEVYRRIERESHEQL